MSQAREPRNLWTMWSKHGHKGSWFSPELVHHEVLRQQDGCAHTFPRLAHSWARAFVSRAKTARHWALFADVNESQINRLNKIETLSKASWLREYSSSSNDKFDTRGVSRALGATYVFILPLLQLKAIFPRGHKQVVFHWENGFWPSRKFVSNDHFQIATILDLCSL